MAREVVRTLLVEDNDIDVGVLTLALQEDPIFDYVIIVLNSVHQAEIFLRNHPEFQLIVLDLVLRNGAGVEMVSRIREVAPHIPLVVVSALEGVDVEIGSIQRFADAFVAKKGMVHETFRSMVRQAIVRRRSAIEASPALALVREARAMLDDCRENPHLPPYAESTDFRRDETIAVARNGK